MKNIKKININYQPNIESLEDERNIVIESINNIYSLKLNENNENNRNYALNVLSDTYRYVPNKFLLIPGRYIRYIDTSDSNDMKLKLGGFVISDNGYSIVYKNTNRLVKLNKKHCILFVSITYNEQLRCAISK